MPPKIADRTRRVNVILPDELVKKIDDWRRRQPELPNISEAVRRMIERGEEVLDKRDRDKQSLTETTPEQTKPRKRQTASRQ